MPYSGNPATSVLDAVRFWLQDTDQDTPLLSDDELQFVLDSQADYVGGNPMRGAQVACSVLRAKYAGEVSISADGVSYSGDQLQQKYEALQASLKAMADELQSTGALPFAGGLDGCGPHSPIPSLFAIGMDDNPYAGYQGRVPRHGDVPYIDPGAS